MVVHACHSNNGGKFKTKGHGPGQCRQKVRLYPQNNQSKKLEAYMAQVVERLLH
jgi:hypothetical protein